MITMRTGPAMAPRAQPEADTLNRAANPSGEVRDIRARTPKSSAPNPTPANATAHTNTVQLGASAARPSPADRTTSADPSTRPPPNRFSAFQQMTTPTKPPAKFALRVIPAVA